MPELDLVSATAGWPVGERAVGVLDAGGVRARSGPDTVFDWASVTKLLTCLTVLDACLDGTLDLDAPAGPPGATVRHLLAHTSGLPFEGAEPAAAPGTRRIYSNTGYDVLADRLAAAAGGPFADELAGRVLGPLAMTGTVLAGSPARGARGPLDDLLRLAGELLAPRVLGPEVVALASTVAFPELSGILPGFGRQRANDWGLGCEIRDHKDPHWTSPENSPRTFGHFGQSGSFLWVDPDAGLACGWLCDTAFGPWAVQRWPELSTRVLHAFAAAAP
ncbi:serine hydrolase domain-containing protein [Nakamurella endophytica]|uniref:Serine hydrolase n=1 Tax=Nakamurella endophytica TaxID=1748367 RepID=A0A917SUE9_9ACTN|nr:serine hydrolase domain-containing protein [Nakamurella endophytica]GGL96645.1 serine hydrolase [Nakamurella endophytica]